MVYMRVAFRVYVTVVECYHMNPSEFEFQNNSDSTVLDVFKQ